MKKQYGFIILFLALILIAPIAFPTTCEPCSECALASYGGTIQPSTSEKVQKVARTAWEKATNVIQKARETVANVRQKITSATEAVCDTVVSVIKWPFQKASEFVTNSFGLHDKESEKSKAQDNAAPKDSSVVQRIDRNLDTYESEKKGDYKSEHYSTEKRTYIRQQATIKLLARALTLKNHFSEIEKLISQIDERVSSSLKNSGGDAGGSIPETENEAKILKENAELRMVWYRLLIFQKQIEATRLEFNANQYLSNMKMVKTTPKVSSSQQGENKK